ncbi:MAG: GNAT superfamily N-acetyltransferase [Nitriliruptoraceae bacterium]
MTLPDGFTIASAPADGAEAIACLGAYYAELAERFDEGFDVSATTSSDAPELTPPHGQLLLVRLHGVAVGVGAVKLLEDRSRAEVKRMWLRPSVRGRGIATVLLACLEAHASQLGATTVVLDTRALLGVVAFYEAKGYARCAPFNANPYPDWWGRKQL